MNRREFIRTTVVTAAAGSTAACGGDEEIARPAGVPVGPFGRDATAEEVTAGLDLSGQTALVTGSNSGIGFETARVLALRGAHVICAARTADKARGACDSMEGRTTPSAFDLADWPSIVAAAEQVRALNTPIDMLICNAGIMELPELQQVYGIERQFAVNHLGHFILVNQLLEQVLAAPQGRIVHVSSGQATRNTPEGGIQFDNLGGEKGYDPTLAYGQSKLANALFSLELAQRLEDNAATSNTVRPGVIPTNLGRHMPAWKPLLLKTVGKLFTKTIPQGAATQVYVATTPALAQTSGYFFEHCNPIHAGGHTEDRAMAARLWQVSEELTADYLDNEPS
ncbi:MAG: SDR family NAD(P)-dependent oxidoreductase [Chromatiales bacterium]|nr:MAG: SDR family NAD(P)-dependent oxidoreductase [Chromatiales bacterium]